MSTVFWRVTAQITLAEAKYGKKASEKVEKAMHERKEGTLKSDQSARK
jgi:Family of unknown function (DUF6496)